MDLVEAARLRRVSGSPTEEAVPIGLAMMGLGAVLAVLAMRRYHVANRGIEKGEVKADRRLVGFVAVFMVLLAM